MLVNPNLTNQEFTGIEQGMTQLRQLLSQIQYMEPRDVAKQLNAAIGTLESNGIQRIIADNDASITAHDEYYGGVATRNGLTTQWGIYSVRMGEFGNVPHAGSFLLQYVDEQGLVYGPVHMEEDPSWLMLWKAADTMIAQSPDADEKTIVNFEFMNGILNIKVAI